MMSIVLLVVLLSGYFVGDVPAVVKYSPELCGIGASAFLVVHAVRHGFARIRFIYWLLIGMLALHVLFGIIVNDMSAGTVIVGGRIYLRTIPFFLLALAVTPSEATLKRQFFVLLGIAAIQLPIAVYQRVSNYQRALTEGYISTTGDYVTGSLGGSAQLSLFLICFSTIILALYSRKRISFRWTAAALLILLAPTMINETKATFLLVPIAFAIPMLAAAGKNRVKNSIKTVVFTVGFIAIFIPVYDYFMVPRWGYGIVEFFTMEGRVEGYLSKDAKVGTTGEAGRLDSISVAVDVLGKDPTSVAFGLGIGSVTESILGPQYEGPYFDRYGIFMSTTYARMLWEIGVLGVVFVLFLIFLVFIDARRAYKRKGAYGVLAQAYLAIVPIMVLGMLYKDLMLSPQIGICFWYYSGVIAAASQFQPSPSIAPTGETESGRARPSNARARAALGSPSMTVKGGVQSSKLSRRFQA